MAQSRCGRLVPHGVGACPVPCDPDGLGLVYLEGGGGGCLVA